MPGFLPWLLRTSGQAAVLVVLVLLVQWLLGERLGPRGRYALWWLVLIRLLLPVAPESRVSLFNGGSYTLAALGWSADGRHSPPAGASGSPIGETAIGRATPFAPADRLPGRAPLTTSHDTRSDVALSPLPASEPNISRHPIAMARFQRWFPALWLAGVTVLALRLFWQNYRFSQRLRHQVPVADARVLQLLADCQRIMSTRRPLVLLETPAVSSPALYGLLRNRLLLPPKFIERFRPEELRHVFLHELAHLKRHDMVVSWLMALLQALHWFNPLIWVAFHRIGGDRESACDELALTAVDADETEAYGRTIIKLLEDLASSAAAPGLVGILESNQQMAKRIRMIARFKKPKWSAPSIAILAALALVTLTDAKTSNAPKTEEPALSTATKPDRSPEPVAGPTSESAAIAALENLGAQIERDEKAPGKPVVKVIVTKGELANEDLRHLRAFPQLGTLLVKAEKITDEGLRELIGLHSLTELTFWSRTQITDSGMAQLAKLPQLQILHLDWCNITDAGMHQIRSLANLRGLTVVSALPHTTSFNRVTDKTCEYLKELSGLERLSLMNCDISSAGLAHLAGLTNLEALNLGANPMVGSEGLKHLVSLVRLKTLYLFDTGVTDGGMEFVTKLERLELLDLSGTSVSDEGLAHLKNLSRLQSLDLGAMKEPYLSIGGAQVTDAGLVHVGEMVNLKKLWLCSNRITDAGLAHLTPLKNLIWLGLDNTRITDRGIASLKELSSLEVLGLGSTRVTDAGLAQLGKLPSLHGVGLSNLAITDEGLRHLKSIKRLKQIQIWGLKETQVTQAGIEELKRARPELQADIQ